MKASTHRPFFTSFFSGALLLTSIVSVLLGWHILDSYSDSRSIQTRDIHLMNLAWTTFHRDEVLTAAAIKAASEGPEWEEHYRESEPAISNAIELMKKCRLKDVEAEAVRRMETAHESLKAIEHRAFELARREDPKAASILLAGDEYESLRDDFLRSINDLRTSVKAGIDSTFDHQGRQARMALALVVITLPVLLVSWLFVLGTIRRHLEARNIAEASLREREERYRELVENANSIILRLDAEGNIVFFNEFAQRFFGYSADEIYGRCLVETIVPSTESSGRDLSSMIDDLIRYPDRFASNENENIRKNGERVWVAWTNKGIRDEQGRITGILCIGNDITSKQRVEKALKLDEARFQALFELSQMAARSVKEIVDFALGQQIELTGSEIGFLGFMDEEERLLTLQSWSEGVMEQCDDKDQIIHFPVEGAGLWAEPVKTRQPLIVNDYLAPRPGKGGYPEGHKTLFRFMSVPVFQDDRIVALAAVANKQAEYDASDVRQITLFLDGVWKMVKQRRTRQELRKSEERYRTLVETMNEGLGVQDENGLLTFVNIRFSQMLGYSKEELLGRSLTDMFGETTRCLLEEQMKLRVRGIKASYEALLRRKNGSLVPVIISAAPVFDGNGAFKGSIGAITDITERKRAEVALKTYASKLERTNLELKDFTFIGSHHLQEPLRKIQIFADLITTRYAKVLDEQGRDYFDRMSRAAKMAQDQVHALLNYSQLSDGPQYLEKVSLQTVAKAALRSLSSDPEEPGILADVESLCEVEVDQEQMIILFRHLAHNALRFRKRAQPSIKIRGKRDGEQCTVFFEDNGIGLDEKYLDLIFKPFQRLHKGTEGVGIGLAICRKIVEGHNGSISATSTAGKGTTFIITLPLEHTREENNLPVPISCAA